MECCVRHFSKLRYEGKIKLNLTGLELGRKRGKIFTQNHRDRISQSLIGKYGELSRNWKGGVEKINNLLRRRIEVKNWKIEIFQRDNFECQICGTNGNKLNCHHIKKWRDFPDLRINKGNGITLCENCHVKLVSYDEQSWESYFNFNLMTRGFI